MGAQTGYMLLRTGRRMEAGIGVSRLGFDITRGCQPAYLTHLCTMVEHYSFMWAEEKQTRSRSRSVISAISSPRTRSHDGLACICQTVRSQLP